MYKSFKNTFYKKAFNWFKPYCKDMFHYSLIYVFVSFIVWSIFETAKKEKVTSCDV